jgi:hypothetical protein
MNSVVKIIVQNIGQEAEHSRKLNDTFINAACLFETYYQKRPSSLLKVCPELQGLTINESEVMEIKSALQNFIEENPGHHNLPAAVKSLALTQDKSLKELFVSRLKLNLAWRNCSNVYCLLLALEDLGEKVFYAADGTFIGSRSFNDADVNFPVAKRYLEKC